MIDELAGEDYPADELEHPAVKTARQTCSACPDQWEGELHDGRHYYFRYRHGRASLALGPTAKSVAGVTGPFQGGALVDAIVAEHGDRMRGAFDSDDERGEVFGRLFDDLTRMREGTPSCSRCGKPHVCTGSAPLGVPTGVFGRCTACGDPHQCEVPA